MASESQRRKGDLCRCTCSCKKPAETTFLTPGGYEWDVCQMCYDDLTNELVPWLP